MCKTVFKHGFQSSPKCVCSFVALEIIYVLVNLIWEMYFIITYYSKERRFNKNFYDVYGSYGANNYDVYGSYGADYDDYDYLTSHDRYKKYTDDDLYWLAPLIFIRK